MHKRPIQWLIVVLTFLLTNGAAQQSGARGRSPRPSKATKAKGPLSFRGLTGGMKLEDARQIVEAMFPTGEGCGKFCKWNCDEDVPGLQDCRVYSHCTDQGRDIYERLSLTFVDGQLAFLTYRFPLENELGTGFDNYSGISDAAREKYGPPTSRTSVDVETNAGAHYPSEELLWDDGTSTVKLQQLCTDIESSCLTLSQTDLTTKWRVRWKAAKKSNV